MILLCIIQWISNSKIFIFYFGMACLVTRMYTVVAIFSNTTSYSSRCRCYFVSIIIEGRAISISLPFRISEFLSKFSLFYQIRQYSVCKRKLPVISILIHTFLLTDEDLHRMFRTHSYLKDHRTALVPLFIPRTVPSSVLIEEMNVLRLVIQRERYLN